MSGFGLEMHPCICFDAIGLKVWLVVGRFT